MRERTSKRGSPLSGRSTVWTFTMVFIWRRTGRKRRKKGQAPPGKCKFGPFIQHEKAASNCITISLSRMVVHTLCGVKRRKCKKEREREGICLGRKNGKNFFLLKKGTKIFWWKKRKKTKSSRNRDNVSLCDLLQFCDLRVHRGVLGGRRSCRVSWKQALLDDVQNYKQVDRQAEAEQLQVFRSIERHLTVFLPFEPPNPSWLVRGNCRAWKIITVLLIFLFFFLFFFSFKD